MTTAERHGRICKNCDNFHPRQANYGECRLHPPQFVFYIENPEERGPVFSQPEVSVSDYCGQFKAKEPEYNPESTDQKDDDLPL